MNFSKKAVVMVLVATIGLSLFVGSVFAATGNDPITQILNALMGINTKIDDLKPISVTVDKTITLGGGAGNFEILPAVEGLTYTGHITLVITSGLGSTHLEVLAFVPGVVPATIADVTVGTIVNEDFTCLKLRILLLDGIQDTPQITFRAVVTYTTSTKVTALT